MNSFLLLLLPVLASCAGTLPADPSKMSAEQLTAWAKDRNANIACSTFSGMYGKGSVNYVVLDKGILASGTLVVDPDCRVTISNAKAVAP